MEVFMKQSIRIWAIVAAAVVMIGLPVESAWARTRMHELAESPYYKEKIGGMLGRGLLNGVTCFVDVIVNTVNDTRTGPPLIGTLTGVAKGVGCGTLRLGSGAVDIVTFWVPGFNGFPVSDSYENCLDTGASSGMSAPAYQEPAPAAYQTQAPAAPMETYSAPSDSGAQTQTTERKWSK
jgi:putative exosortase-associated protein (TIGR04073 family)